MSRIFFPFLLLQSFLFFPIYAREIPPPIPELRGSPEFFRQALGEQDSPYLLLEGDLFEEEGKEEYFPHAPSNILCDIRYISKTASQEEAFARDFAKEKRIVREHLGSKKGFRSSLFVQTAFTDPGKQSLVLKRRRPVFLEGKLLRASFWVHSQNYPHRLVLLFKNSRGKLVPLKGIRLFWRGWKQVNLNLELSGLEADKRRNSPRYRPSFIGFRILSAPNSKADSIALLFDNLLFLSSQRGRRYPGSEIEDR